MTKFAPVLAVIGMILVAFQYPLYGMGIWSISNIWLGYINRKDKGQLYMYIIYEVFSIVGVCNYTQIF